MTIRTVLADDHQMFRQGLRALLDKHPEIDVVGEADHGRAVLTLVRKFRPHVVIMDVTMPELNGIDATGRIKSEAPATKVLGLSMHDDTRYVSRMLRAGASAYLLKNCAFEELADALRTVMSGEIYLSPRIAAAVVREALRRADGPLETLSLREREVLQLIAEARETVEIADALNISPKTVESHRGKIKEKLGCRNVAEMVRIALREGLTSLEP